MSLRSLLVLSRVATGAMGSARTSGLSTVHLPSVILHEVFHEPHNCHRDNKEVTWAAVRARNWSIVDLAEVEKFRISKLAGPVAPAIHHEVASVCDDPEIRRCAIHFNGFTMRSRVRATLSAGVRRSHSSPLKKEKSLQHQLFRRKSLPTLLDSGG